jgi:membrane protease YdiL (CAAX protease family)
MFNRYWRSYPWLMQIIMLMLLVFTLTSFFTVVILTVLPAASGLTAQEFTRLGTGSSAKAIRTGLLTQAISHIGTFSVPALLFAGWTHPRMAEYLGLRKPKNPLHWLLSAGIILGIEPVFLCGESWMMHHLHFGAQAAEMQKATDDTVQAFLSLRGAGMPVVLLFVLALVPAFGEELLFRGILMRLVHRRFRKDAEENETVLPQSAQKQMLIPVIFTALLFAAIHYNPYGFVFIFIAGVLLALIYYLTGSLLCSMLAHFLYNGTQVALAMVSDHGASTSPADPSPVPLVLVISGFLLFLGCFYALLRTQRPLPPDWSSDYAPGEV